MPLQRCEGIVLRTYPLGDTSRIVVAYTREMGVLRMVAKGARQDLGTPPKATAKGNGESKEGMVLRGPNDEELMSVESLKRVGDELVIKGKSFGTMPMEARLDAASARAGLKMLGLKQLAFLATLPFRSGKGHS